MILQLAFLGGRTEVQVRRSDLKVEGVTQLVKRKPRWSPLRLTGNFLSFALGRVGASYRDFFGEGGYRTLEEYQADIRGLAASFDTASVHALDPKTHQARTIELLRIRDPGLPENAPRVLVTGLLHAREFISGETALGFAEAALADSPLARRAEIDIVAVVNPDGVAINLARQRRLGRLGPLWRGNAEGVDLNRNFGARYSNAQRTYKFRFSPEYSGTGPFSEPESKALRQLCARRNYAAAINLHSYSSVMLFPWFADNDVDPVVAEIASKLPDVQPTERYRPIAGSVFMREWKFVDLAFRLARGTRWVNGTFEDWLYSTGTHALLIEVSSPGPLFEHLGEMAVSDLRVFNPAPCDRQATIDNVVPAMFAFFDAVLDKPAPHPPRPGFSF
jgi:hypothetical protein